MSESDCNSYIRKYVDIERISLDFFMLAWNRWAFLNSYHSFDRAIFSLANVSDSAQFTDLIIFSKVFIAIHMLKLEVETYKQLTSALSEVCTI